MILWATFGVLLIYAAVLLLTVVELSGETPDRRRWARRVMAVTAFAGMVGLVIEGVSDGFHPPILFGSIAVLWACWFLYRRVRATERWFRSKPLRDRMYVFDVGFAVQAILVLTVSALDATETAGRADADVLAESAPWVTVHSNQPLMLDPIVHGRFCDREDRGATGYRYHYEGFRLIWSNVGFRS
ncbi:hypothetical protein [Lentzea sp. NPDC004782]|uniref:hypothetical protein n=1 Tax=Lentzea sp. NPDC004782 TaxID=3154458 RepID=UPI0033ADE497